ncbi:MAG: hypothetical protein Q3986_05615 [Akkermansia sp.]|nr:hypothetical protein [Akkermansia sp.]
MRAQHIIIALALAAAPAGAAVAVPVHESNRPQSFQDLPFDSAQRLEGSLTGMYRSFYWGRGLVATQEAEQGEGVETVAFKATYDFGDKGGWTFNETVAYSIFSAGHTLYGNPTFSRNGAAIVLRQRIPNFDSLPPEKQEYLISQLEGKTIKQCNMENEFAVVTACKYTHEYFNVTLGHDFVHGGILGVMAKHYRDQGASMVHECFIATEFTPYKWLAVGCTTRFSFAGIRGWWFEPYANFRFPIIGSADDVENIRWLGVVQFGMSATADYFRSHYFACDNGSQGYWIKLTAPYFITRNWILTPGVTFNWAGRGAMKANTKSELRPLTGKSSTVPFREFAIVSDISLTYRF